MRERDLLRDVRACVAKGALHQRGRRAELRIDQRDSYVQGCIYTEENHPSYTLQVVLSQKIVRPGLVALPGTDLVDPHVENIHQQTSDVYLFPRFFEEFAGSQET
jgi:hypothetical protein